MELRENAIEWITGDDYAIVSLTQRKYITRVRKLAEKYPTMARIEAQNKDGSICARISLRAVHLSIFGGKNIAPDDDSEEE